LSSIRAASNSSGSSTAACVARTTRTTVSASVIASMAICVVLLSSLARMPGRSARSSLAVKCPVRDRIVEPRKFVSSPVSSPVSPRNSADLPEDSKPISTAVRDISGAWVSMCSPPRSSSDRSASSPVCGIPPMAAYPAQAAPQSLPPPRQTVAGIYR